MKIRISVAFLMLIALSGYFLMLGSCMSTRTSVPKPLVPNLGNTASDITDASKAIEGTTKTISQVEADLTKDANSIEAKDDDRVMSPEVSDIRHNVAVLGGERSKLQQVTTKLAETKGDLALKQTQVEQMEEALDDSLKREEDWEKKWEKSEKEKKEALFGKMMFAVYAGIGLIGLAAMMLFNGNKNALKIGVAGIIVCVASLAIAFYGAKLALIGVIAVVVAIGSVGFFVYKETREKKSKDTAVYELTKTVEHLKPHIEKTKRTSLFGDLITDGEVGTLQSPETKDMVDAERKKIGERASPTIPENM